MPANVVERISRAVQAVLTDKEFTERRAKLGDMAVPYQTPAEFGRFLQAEDERYRALATGLKLE
jgi:tripartite-type tricarboxylate transporter receptor subunit TctC